MINGLLSFRCPQESSIASTIQHIYSLYSCFKELWVISLWILCLTTYHSSFYMMLQWIGLCNMQVCLVLFKQVYVLLYATTTKILPSTILIHLAALLFSLSWFLMVLLLLVEDHNYINSQSLYLLLFYFVPCCFIIFCSIGYPYILAIFFSVKFCKYFFL